MFTFLSKARLSYTLNNFYTKIKNNFALKSHSHTTVNGHTVESDVPANAKFTDTTYTEATQSKSGLLSASDKKLLDELVAWKKQVESGSSDVMIDTTE